MTALSGPFRRACVFVSAAVVSLALQPAPADAAAPSDNTATPVVRYADILRSFNPAFSSSQSQDMATHVLLLSSYYSLDPRLLVAIIGVESSWRTGAVSSAGARGLGQLMPATASGLGVRTFDAYENLDGTARYLRRLMLRYAGLGPEARYTLALASYNSGSEAVARFGGIPPFAETRAYVSRVMALWHNLRALLPGGGDVVPAVPHPPAPRPVVARPKNVAPAKAEVERGSVADFTMLDARSVSDFLADVSALRAVVAAAPAPAPTRTREPKSLKHWFARAFGGAAH